MAKIQFTGIRNLGKLFGILSQRSVPTELNIEDGISVVYDVNEAIQEEVGNTYRYHSSLTILAAGVSGFATLNPFTSSPSIPRAFVANCYVVSASFTVILSFGDFQRAALQLHQITGDILEQSTLPVGGAQAIAVYSDGVSPLAGESLLIAGTASPDPFLVTMPFKLPSDGVFVAGAGNELRFAVAKAAGGADFIVEIWLDFWAGPPGVRCPWL